MHRATSRWFMYVSVLYAGMCAVLTANVHPEGWPFAADMGQVAVGQWYGLWSKVPILCTLVPIGVVLFLSIFSPSHSS